MSTDDKPGSDYNGPDQRRERRRKIKDRRQEFRFEPDKEDRRKNSGRRKGDENVWNSTI